MSTANRPFLDLLAGLGSERRRGGVRRPTRARPVGKEVWTLLALLAATLIALVNGATSSFVITALVLPPIFATAKTDSRQTALVAAYCTVLVVLSRLWDPGVNPRYVVQVGVVIASGGLSVWNAMLREGLSAEARGGMMLGRSLTQLDNVLERAATAQRVANAAVPDLADIAILDLLEEDGSIRAAAIVGTDRDAATAVKQVRHKVRLDVNGSSPVAEVIRSGESRAYEHMTDPNWREMAVDDNHLQMLRSFGPRSMLVVPLKDQGIAFGSLSLGALDSDNRYGPEEIALAEELARRASRGITNARLHERQAKLASTLQASLLPRALPEIEGFEIAAGFSPAGGPGAQIGGDFYDVFQMRKASWKAVIGDVCGKGPEAAAMTSLMRDTLRAAALRGDTPSESLLLLNAAILESGSDGRFCTSVVARFELGTPVKLTTCNGGHPPPLVLRENGTVEPIGPAGTLLGIYPDIDLADSTTTLEPGDLVLLYTDGLFEVPPEATSSEIDVQALLSECKGSSAKETAARLEERVLTLQGGEPHDDIAMLVMRHL